MDREKNRVRFRSCRFWFGGIRRDGMDGVRQLA